MRVALGRGSPRRSPEGLTLLAPGPPERPRSVALRISLSTGAGLAANFSKYRWRGPSHEPALAQRGVLPCLLASCDPRSAPSAMQPNPAEAFVGRPRDGRSAPLCAQQGGVHGCLQRPALPRGVVWASAVRPVAQALFGSGRRVVFSAPPAIDGPPNKKCVCKRSSVFVSIHAYCL